MVATQGFESDDEQAEGPSLRPRHSGGIEGTMLGPGSVLEGRYRIERVLGEGGMGIVYRASHVNLKRQVAIKLLHPDVAKDPVIFERFRQEAQSASAIGHRNIVDIRDFGVLEDGTSYIVMEHLEGRDLHDLIEAFGPVPPSMVVALGVQIAEGLAAAHAAGIIHRDLKPDNIFLVESQDPVPLVKILDFGIAKAASSPSRLTKSGQVFGTPQYMSPEQCSGQHVDERSDVYALGTVLYEMLVGAPPFKADTLMGVLTKQMYEKPRPPSTYSLPFSLPQALEDLVMRCLAKRPARRYASMATLLNALRDIECLNEDGSRMTPEISWQPQPSSLVPPMATDEQQEDNHLVNRMAVPELRALDGQGVRMSVDEAPSTLESDPDSDIPDGLPMLWFSGASFRRLHRSPLGGVILTLLLAVIVILLATDWANKDRPDASAIEKTDPPAGTEIGPTNGKSATQVGVSPSRRGSGSVSDIALDANGDQEEPAPENMGSLEADAADARRDKDAGPQAPGPNVEAAPGTSGALRRAPRPPAASGRGDKAPAGGGLRLVDPWE